MNRSITITAARQVTAMVVTQTCARLNSAMFATCKYLANCLVIKTANDVKYMLTVQVGAEIGTNRNDHKMQASLSHISGFVRKEGCSYTIVGRRWRILMNGSDAQRSRQV
jgi:hypothetical protein